MNELTPHQALIIQNALRLSKLGNISAAEQIFHDVLIANDQSPFLNYLFGYEYIRHGMFNQSLIYFEKAIELDRVCLPAWGGLGRALIALERWDDAELPLRRRLELGESSNHYVYLSMVMLQQSKFQEALTYCERALHLNGHQVDALLNQAFAYSMINLHEQAEESCRQAIELDGLYDDSYICLGFILSRANQMDAASDALHHALDINPQSASAYLELGALHSSQGDPILARLYLQTGKDLFEAGKSLGAKPFNDKGDSHACGE